MASSLWNEKYAGKASQDISSTRYIHKKNTKNKGKLTNNIVRYEACMRTNAAEHRTQQHRSMIHVSYRINHNNIKSDEATTQIQHVQNNHDSGQQLLDRLQASGFRLQASGFRLQASGFRLQASGFRLQASGFRLQRDGLFSHTFKTTANLDRPSRNLDDTRITLCNTMSLDG
jgi:hypothetical protein